MVVMVIIGICIAWDVLSILGVGPSHPGPFAMLGHDLTFLLGVSGIVGFMLFYVFFIFACVFAGKVSDACDKRWQTMGQANSNSHALKTAIPILVFSISFLFIMFLVINLRGEAASALIDRSESFTYKKERTPTTKGYTSPNGRLFQRRAFLSAGMRTTKKNWKSRLKDDALFLPSLWNTLLISKAK